MDKEKVLIEPHTPKFLTDSAGQKGLLKMVVGKYAFNLSLCLFEPNTMSVLSGFSLSLLVVQMNSSDINLGVICIKMKLYFFMFTNNQTEGEVYNENNNLGFKKELWGTLTRSLQRSGRVELIFIDW